MSEKQKKVLILSLLSYTLGGFLYAVGLKLSTTLTIIAFYLIAIALIGSGILCLYNNYKLEKQTKLYLFLAFIGIFLLTFLTIVTFSQI